MRHVFFWLVLVSFTAVAAVLLFFSKPLFLGGMGVKAKLTERAARLKGQPAERVSAEVGRMLKAYLDASKHASRAEVTIEKATAERLVLSLLLPWAEVSAKKRRQRAEAAARLAVDMLKRAGAERVAVTVRVRRRRKDPTKSDPAGRFVYGPGGKGFTWRAGAP